VSDRSGATGALNQGCRAPSFAAGANHGVTLVELLVVIGITVVMILVGVPLTRAWIANSHIARAEATLLQAYQGARAAALLNAKKITDTNTVATIDVSVHPTVSVTDSTATVLWSGTTDADSTVTFTTGTCNNQLSLNNGGNPTIAACTAYSVNASGGTTITGTLH
jgi:Tfp pilus assembly protein FimT